MHWLTLLTKALARPFYWWVVVAPWEQGLRVRLGKTAKALHPGWHFKIPFFDRVYVQSVRSRTMSRQNATATTKDGKSVVFSLAIHFAVADIKQLFDSLSTPEATLAAKATAVAATHISEHERADISTTSLGQEITSNLGMDGVGLSDIVVEVFMLADVRAYRFISAEYSESASLKNFEAEGGCGLRQ